MPGRSSCFPATRSTRFAPHRRLAAEAIIDSNSLSGALFAECRTDHPRTGIRCRLRMGAPTASDPRVSAIADGSQRRSAGRNALFDFAGDRRERRRRSRAPIGLRAPYSLTVGQAAENTGRAKASRRKEPRRRMRPTFADIARNVSYEPRRSNPPSAVRLAGAGRGYRLLRVGGRRQAQ